MPKSKTPEQTREVGSRDLLAVFEILKFKPDKKKEDLKHGKLKSTDQQRPAFPKGPPNGSTWDFSMVPRDSSFLHHGD